MAIRVGDFFEFYGEDAKTVARELEITLTGKEDGGFGRIPMAGVPHHSIEKYLAKLLSKGFKVALCDQLEDPKLAKGLVKRGITRVLTPGTVLEESMLPGKSNNYLCALELFADTLALATVDSSTGEIVVTQASGRDAPEKIIQEFSRLKPSEVLSSPETLQLANQLKEPFGFTLTERPSIKSTKGSEMIKEQFNVAQLEGFGIADQLASQIAIAMLLDYAKFLHLEMDHFCFPSAYQIDDFMRIDIATRRALELTENMTDGSKSLTLLESLDQTQTPMGGRMLKRFIEQPLLNSDEIQSRLEAVDRFVKHPTCREDFRAEVKAIVDIERLIARASNGLAGPRDMVALRFSLEILPKLCQILQLVSLGKIHELRSSIGDFRTLAQELRLGLIDDPPITLKDGGAIRPGVDPELDKLRSLTTDGKSFIAELETTERQKTQISTLKVGFNSVFGYYLEVPKSQQAKVPSHYIRKQTTANSERYITAELKDHEATVMSAKEKSITLESEIFAQLRSKVASQASDLLKTARSIAELDVLSTFAEIAVRSYYVKPEIVEDDVIEILAGRHPVVETKSSDFVPNDLEISISTGRTHIITGPNMAGKSTFLRQNALIVAMAQIGSFVPAVKCKLGLCDRIFARIGARDELALGQSTFMVEMVESANILNHATKQSLVILDEVGRGTSTFDGLAIAWAMIEHLMVLAPKTLFATHYHQLNAIADQSPMVLNFRASVEENEGQIVWTHRILPGGTDRSYGIHVAKMAGVPKAVLQRSEQILASLEGKELPVDIPAASKARFQYQLFELEDPEVIRELKELDLNRLTPLMALQMIDSWKRKVSN